MSLPSLIEMTTLPLFTVVTAPCTFISTAAGASACPSSASCEALSDTSLNPYFLLAQKNRGAISPLSFLSYSLPHCSAFYTISNACCSQPSQLPRIAAASTPRIRAISQCFNLLSMMRPPRAERPPISFLHYGRPAPLLYPRHGKLCKTLRAWPASGPDWPRPGPDGR